MTKAEKQKSTDELKQDLMESVDIKEFLSENESSFQSEKSFEYLRKLYESSKLTKAELARRSGVSEVYLHQIFAGRRNPSRDRLIGIAIGLELSLADTQTLLLHCSKAQLYAKIRRDAIIIYGISNGYELSQVNEELLNAGEAELK